METEGGEEGKEGGGEGRKREAVSPFEKKGRRAAGTVVELPPIGSGVGSISETPLPERATRGPPAADVAERAGQVEEMGEEKTPTSGEETTATSSSSLGSEGEGPGLKAGRGA